MRQVFCKHYSRCLDRAAHENADDLSCSSCQYRHDQDVKQQITTEDPAGCRALVLAILNPESYSEHHPQYWRNRFIKNSSYN